MIFHELTAVNVVSAYSVTIFEDILGKDKTSGFTPREATYALGCMSVIGTFMSVFTLRAFGRRTLLLFGHIGMSITWLLMGIFTLIEFNYGCLGMICIFVLIYD